MIRLSLSLYVAVVATIVLSIVLAASVPKKIVSRGVEGFYRQSFSGVFDLLDERIESKTDNEISAELDALQRRFPYPLDLIETQSDYFDDDDRARIDLGKIVMVEIDEASHLFRKSRHTDRVWLYAIELRTSEDSYRSAIGVFELVQDRLAGKNQQQRNAEYNRLKQLFDVPVNFATASELDLSDTELTKIQRGDLVIRNPDDDYEQYFMKIRDTDEVVAVGPIRYPAMLRLLPLAILTFLGSMLALGLTVWGRPLVRDLRRLRRASIDFGQGQLDTRLTPSRTNMIGPVIEGFNNMAQQTQNLIASQRDLTNAVSHELRTPLARIKFSLEMLNSVESGNQRRYIDDMNLDVDELNTLVDELLTYARHENPQGEPSGLSLEFVCLGDWLSSQIQRANRQQHNHTITCEIINLETDEHGWIDPRLMSRAVSNGIQNAIRHADSKICVLLQKEIDHYVICVDDDGPGVPPELRQRVFEPFTRADISRNRQTGGFGLGLAIVAKIAKWHNGHAVISESRFGGARIEIHWPLIEHKSQDH